MKRLYRCWLRLILCEPEERAELTYNHPKPWEYHTQEDYNADVDAYIRRVRRYETAFGPFHPY